jgi:hypothetical protein
MPKEPKIPTSFRLTATAAAILSEIADRLGTTKTEVIETAIREFASDPRVRASH